jgi:hypothetical protein
MSTIKSSTEHLTLNADGSGKDIKFQANGVEKASISSTGVMTATSYAGDGSALTNLPAGGKVLQVKSVSESARVAYSSSAGSFITVLSLSITPTSTTSKIYLVVNANVDGAGRYVALNMYRGSTQIGMGDANGSAARVSASSMRNGSATLDEYVMHNSSISFMDEPSTTSATTYNIKIGNTYGTASVYLNRPSYLDDGNTYTPTGNSTFTLMEIGA